MDCENKFKCAGSAICIPNSYLCDNEKDCPSGDDENNCNETLDLIESKCNSNEFQCSKPLRNSTSYKMCIPKHWACDGYEDCVNKEDEKDCPGNY